MRRYKDALKLPQAEYDQLRAVDADQVEAKERAWHAEREAERLARATARQTERDARSAADAERRAIRDALVKARPTARLRALEVGEDTLFAKKLPQQLSAIVANVTHRTGYHFTMRTERCLITDELRGVRVTRID